MAFIVQNRDEEIHLVFFCDVEMSLYVFVICIQKNERVVAQYYYIMIEIIAYNICIKIQNTQTHS